MEFLCRRHQGQLLLLLVFGEIIIKEAQHPENTNWRNLHCGRFGKICARNSHLETGRQFFQKWTLATACLESVCLQRAQQMSSLDFLFQISCPMWSSFELITFPIPIGPKVVDCTNSDRGRVSADGWNMINMFGLCTSRTSAIKILGGMSSQMSDARKGCTTREPESAEAG